LGIGRAAAHQFAQNGAKAVYICDYDTKNLETHRREMLTSWPEVDIHVRGFDAADDAAVQEVVNHAVTNYGRLDVFFANAGVVGTHALFTDIEASDFMETMRVNALGYGILAS
jgi:NAD(P)-dependent dehydrogenase (short-subunit alcohol dehydrogenase family)